MKIPTVSISTPRAQRAFAWAGFAAALIIIAIALAGCNDSTANARMAAGYAPYCAEETTDVFNGVNVRCLRWEWRCQRDVCDPMPGVSDAAGGLPGTGHDR